MSRRRLNYDFFRRRLEEEKRRLGAGLRNIDLRLAGKGPLAEAEAGQDLDEHQGDAATEDMQRQTDLAHQDNVQQLLNQIEMALRKIEEGSYGLCGRCRQEIGEARLQALPWANLCVTCQGRVE